MEPTLKQWNIPLDKGHGKSMALLLFHSPPGQGLTLITPESIGPTLL
jgi:hypothetical protein